MSKSESNGKTAGPPRLCHVVKVDDFDGYGFNLHAEKGKPGQYIGKVDDGSPAELAGLRQGDRIIEVNGVNIGRETHKEVVQRIKAIASEVQLLVVDPSVPVTKDNRLVDPVPVNGVAKTNGNHSERSPDTAPAAVASSITPDIVVQLPSTPSTPKLTEHGSRPSSVGHDQTDHVAAHDRSSVPSSPVSVDKQRSTTTTHATDDDIVAIKVNNDSVTPITVNTSKTSTFSTSPKDHSPTYNSMFISTASFSTGDEPAAADEVKIVTNITVNPTSSTTTTHSSSPSPSPSPPPPSSSSPLLPKSDVDNLPSVTSGSAIPPPATKTIPSSPTVPIAVTTPIAPPPATVAAAAVPHQPPLANGSATQSPPPPSSVVAQTNGTATATGANASGLNLNMTVAELRAKLAAKKKFDPKADQVDVRKKYEIVEKL